MVVMIFLIGLLLGVLAGGALCVRYLRQEIAADVGPRLRQMQMQLDNLDREINLALATRLADLSRGDLQVPATAGGDRDGSRRAT
jgi:uncharacterized membrane-anchored protein YhcB (DUF1043 family)